MNILFTSSGRRSYLIEYFKEELKGIGEVHAANSSPDAPALRVADKAVVTPLIYDTSYISFLLEYCQQHAIKAIIPLFDIDLPILANHKQDFEVIGTQVIVSDERVIDICNDKWKTYQFLVKNKFNTPATFLSVADAVEAIAQKKINYPLIIKPRWGMGSIAVQEADNEEELAILYTKVKREIFRSYLSFESEQDNDNCILIQEKLKGQEHGLDIINDLKGKYQATIVKKKIAMRSGETDSAETVHSPAMLELGERMSKALQHIANLDTDVFLVDNVPYVLEMNARFGGGYPFSHLAGVNLPGAIIAWLNDKQVNENDFKPEIGVKGLKELTITRV